MSGCFAFAVVLAVLCVALELWLRAEQAGLWPRPPVLGAPVAPARPAAKPPPPAAAAVARGKRMSEDGD